MNLRRAISTQSCKVCGGEGHEPGRCWFWIDEAERQRRYALPYWVARIKAAGLDPRTMQPRQEIVSKSRVEWEENNESNQVSDTVEGDSGEVSGL